MAGRLSVLLCLFFIMTTFIAVYSLPVIETSREEARDLERRVTRVGRATWFNVGLGNCGKRSVNSDPVVAMGKAFYDRNNGGNCGQWVEIINSQTRAKAYGQLWDSCPSCDDNQIDLSPSLFQKFASLGAGVFTAEWHFMAAGWHP